MYYNAGRPLDIGGGMTCDLSTKPDNTGFATLVVRQPPNLQTHKVRFESADKAIVYNGRAAARSAR